MFLRVVFLCFWVLVGCLNFRWIGWDVGLLDGLLVSLDIRWLRLVGGMWLVQV